MALKFDQFFFVFLVYGLLTTSTSSSSCLPGFYFPEHDRENIRNCAAWLSCPSGSFCSGDGVKRQCPSGSYGKNKNLQTEDCDGPCQRGYYCPLGTKDNGIICPEDHYCPEGSSHPLETPVGHFTLPFDRQPNMGVRGGAANQNAINLCHAGSYCPGDGTSRLCPGGTFGSHTGLSSSNCSGACQGGYYCPSGSTSPTQLPCAHLQPSSTHAQHFCPPGSSYPIPTREGFYAVLEGESQSDGYRGDTATIAISFNISTSLEPITQRRADLKAQIAQKVLLLDESAIGRFAVVPFPNIWAVRFEATASVSAAGYQTAVKWKDGVKLALASSGVFDNSVSSGSSLAVAGESIRGVVAGRRPKSWNTQSDVSSLASSEPSLWHSTVPLLLQFNISAKVAKLDDASCLLNSNQTSHLKQAVLTALGLDSSPQTLPPDRFQVRTVGRTRKHATFNETGHPHPHTSSHIGVWSVEVVWAVSMEVSQPEALATRDDGFAVTILPTDNDSPGHMGWRGNTDGLKDGLGRVRYGDGTGRDGDGASDFSLGDGHRSGTRVDVVERWAAAAHSALAGPLFQAATVSALQTSSDQEPFYVTVDPSLVSVTSSAHWAGSWSSGIREHSVLDFNGETFVSEPFVETVKFGRTGYAVERPCPAGHYCISGQKYECPAGRYGARERSQDPACDGPCHAGYYCPAGSISPNERKCGLKGDSSVYCPPGVSSPQLAQPGYYTYGDIGSRVLALPWSDMDSDADGFINWAEFKAPFLTDEGEARALWKLADKDDSKLLDPREYSTVVTVLGPHGASARSTREFHVDPSAHLPLGAAMNSTHYGDTHFHLGTIETRSHVEVCDEGHYCIQGIRHPCPRGVYGASKGLSTPHCSGVCDPGYYCPDRSTSPRGSSMVTSPRRDELVCGNDTVFCPVGSRWPQAVAVGYYTTGGVEDGSTRSAEARCDPGSYCVAGRRYPCLAGFFGASYGLTDPKCSGLCSAGFYCPVGSIKGEEYPCGDPSQVCAEGSSLPHQVPLGRYSVNGVCSDVWPPKLRMKTIVPRAGFPVWSSKEVEGITNHAEWKSGHSWTLQVVVTSECSAPVRFGFAYGEGTLLFTVPALAANMLIRVSDEVSVTRTPRSTHFQAFDSCEDRNVTFHEARISPGICPGFDSPPLGECVETTWTSRLDFLDEAVRNEDTTETKSSLITFLARSVAEVSPDLESPILASNYFEAIPNLSQLATPLSDMLNRKTWVPCEYVNKSGRLIYNDNRVGVWIQGEPIWWRLAQTWPETNVDMLWPQPLPTFKLGVTGGVARRTAISMAPRGHFAVRGLLYECPAGKYGSVLGLKDAECSGCCEEGYYCPPASIHRRQIPCGGTDRYCPKCSPHPLPVLPGYYTSTVETEACPPGTWRNLSALFDPTLNPETNQQTEQSKSSLSTSVQHSASWGVGSINAASNGRGDGAGDGWSIGPLSPCVFCPPGRYKATTGDSLDLCLACDEPTTGALSTEDFVGCNCLRAPGGESAEFLRFSAQTGACESVSSVNETAVGEISLRNSTLTRFKQHPCERGFFCQEGVRTVCPSTRYGSTELNTDPQCSGECAPGYFCPEGSTSAFQFPCGGADRYCPAGSDTPLLVKVGWFTNEEAHENIRSFETICPKGYWCEAGVRRPCEAGLWGGTEGLSTAECSGECAPGYYCPEASISPYQVPCGNSTVYCLPKAPLPTKVLEGFYGTHATSYEGRRALQDPTNATLSAQLPCEPGYYCSGGIKQPCRAGLFGWTYGASSAQCGGLCSAGYRCPMASVVAKPLECAASLQTKDVSTVYCPPGTADTPRIVRSGYYSVGGGAFNTTRTNEVKCEAGWWCVGGVKQPCPAGSYGRTRGLSTNRCTAVCPAGFACPEATIEPVKCGRGTYSTGGARKCNACPGSSHHKQTCVNARSCCGY
mmetsp:Transcript_2593/g.3535  ORF Transcript_2593/g.3535 Transcript_2593/m.3535 type:complete len:1916 (-) Transcript_2593:156-5903(-)